MIELHMPSSPHSSIASLSFLFLKITSIISVQQSVLRNSKGLACENIPIPPPPNMYDEPWDMPAWYPLQLVPWQLMQP